MALTLKQDFTQVTAAAAAQVGPTLSGSRGSSAMKHNAAGTLVLAPSARQVTDIRQFRSAVGSELSFLNVADPVITVSCWIRATTAADRNWPWTIADSTAASNAVWFGLELTSSTYRFGARNTTPYNADATTAVDTDWHLVTCVMRSSIDREIYYDGLSEATSTDAVSFAGASLDRIASGELTRLSIFPNASETDILDLAVWDRALSDAEILALTTNRPGDAAGGAPIHWWKCNDWEDLEDSGSVGTLTLEEDNAPPAVADVPITYTAVDTVMRQAAYTYDGSAWVNRGVLIEEARTNDLLNSGDFTAATWGVTGEGTATTLTRDGNQGTAPDGSTGTVTQIDIISDANNGVFDLLTAGTTSRVYATSVYFKIDSASVNHNWWRLMYYNGGGSAQIRQYFDLNNDTDGIPTLGSFNSGAGGTEVSGSNFLEKIGDDGWYRIGFAGSNDLDTTRYFEFKAVDADNNALTTTVDGASLKIWGPQIETNGADANFVSSYMPTNSAAVTRADDSLTGDVSFLDTASTVQGTFALTAYNSDVHATVSRDRFLLQVDDGGANDRFKLREASSERWHFTSNNSGAGASISVVSAINQAPGGVEVKAAFSYTAAAQSISVGGNVAVTNGVGDVPLNAASTTLRVGCWHGSILRYGGFIKDLRYWDEPKPDLWLAAPPAMGTETDRRLKYDFKKDTLAMSAITGPVPVFDRGSGAMQFNGAGVLVWAPENWFENAEDVGGARWTNQAGCTTTQNEADPDGGNDATRLAMTAGGEYAITGAWGQAVGATINVGVWVKGVSATGVFNLGNTANIVLYGEWTIDTSLLSGDWELLVPGHGAVTEDTPFSFQGTNDGFHFAWVSGSPEVLVYHPQANRGPALTGFVPTDSGEGPTPGPRLASHVYDTTMSAWVNRGYISEQARTNVLFPSSDFQTTWIDTNVTATAAQLTAPDGTLTGTTVVGDGVSTGGYTLAYTQAAVVVSPSIPYTFSVFLQYVDQRYIHILMDASFPQTAVVVDLVADPPTVTTSSGGPGAPEFANAVVFGDWVRIDITDSTDDTAGLQVVLYHSEDATWAGRVIDPAISTSYGIWGAQFERAKFVSTHIPTTTAEVTRAADGLYIENSALELNSYGYSDISDGTWIADLHTTAIVSAQLGNGTEPVWLGDDAATQAFGYWDEGGQFRYYDSAQFDDIADPAAVAGNTSYKWAMGYKTAATPTLTVSINGATAEPFSGASSYQGDWDVTNRDLYIGRSTIGHQWFGHVTTLEFYEYKLSDADLQIPPAFSGTKLRTIMALTPGRMLIRG